MTNNLVITCARKLVEELNKLTPDNTAKYDFMIVEEFGTFERTPAADREEVKLKGIRKIHQITYRGSSLTALPLSGLSCARLQAQCEECASLPPTVTKEKLAGLLRKEVVVVQETEGVEEEQEEGRAVAAMPGDVLEQSDGEGEEGGEEVEDVEEVEVGDVVWGLRYGKRQPAIIVPLSEVPQPRQKAIQSRKVCAFIYRII